MNQFLLIFVRILSLDGNLGCALWFDLMEIVRLSSTGWFLRFRRVELEPSDELSVVFL